MECVAEKLINVTRIVTYGEILGHLMKKRGVTAGAIQSRLNIARGFIEDLISGEEHGTPSREIHCRLAELLELNNTDQALFDAAQQNGEAEVPENYLPKKTTDPKETATKKLGAFIKNIVGQCPDSHVKGISDDRLLLFTEGIVVPTKEEAKLLKSQCQVDFAPAMLEALMEQALIECIPLFAMLLYKYRTGKGISQTQLGVKTGIAQSVLSSMELNNNSRPSKIMEDVVIFKKEFELTGVEWEEFFFAATVRLRLRERELMPDITLNQQTPTGLVPVGAPTPSASSLPVLPADKKTIQPKKEIQPPLPKPVRETKPIERADKSNISILSIPKESIANQARGEYLKKLRLSNDKCGSVEELAEMLVMPVEIIQKIENGEPAEFIDIVMVAKGLGLNEQRLHALCSMMSLSELPIVITLPGGSTERILRFMQFMMQETPIKS